MKVLRDLAADATKGAFDPETGDRYVFLSAREAAEELNVNRDTAAADLKALVDGGHLERKQLGGIGTRPDGRKTSCGQRAWFYKLGSVLPEWFNKVRNAVRKKRANHCPVAGQSSKGNPLRDSFPKGANAHNNRTASPDEQGHAPAPGHEATQAVIAEMNSWPPTLAELKARGESPPHETNATQPMLDVTEAEQQAIDERAKTMSVEEAHQILDNEELFIPLTPEEAEVEGTETSCEPKPEHRIEVMTAYQVDSARITPELFDMLSRTASKSPFQWAGGKKLKAKKGFA